MAAFVIMRTTYETEGCPERSILPAEVVLTCREDAELRAAELNRTADPLAEYDAFEVPITTD